MTNLDKIRLLFSMAILAYIIAIIMALANRKKEPVKKKYYKNNTVFNAVSVFKQGQSLLKQSFVTMNAFLEIVQYLKAVISVPIPPPSINVR